MKKVSKLTESELDTLESAFKYHPSTRVRNRAQVIILSSKEFQLKEIAEICLMTRQTVSTVIDQWESKGLVGLYDEPRSGRPRSLTPEEEEFVAEMAGQEPRSIKKIVAVVEDQTGKKVSKKTIKRIIQGFRFLSKKQS